MNQIEAVKDPVMRCASCGNLIKRNTIRSLGCCNKCGMKRVTTVVFLSDEEKTDLANRGVDQEWIDEFCKEVPDE